MNHRGLRILLVVHGIVTLAAGVVLSLRPGLIPGTVGVRLAPEANIVAYLLAGAEFGFSFLSLAASRLGDENALRLVAWSCIAFHGTSAVLEIHAYVQGLGSAILPNVAARVIVVALFAYLSRRRA